MAALIPLPTTRTRRLANLSLCWPSTSGKTLKMRPDDRRRRSPRAGSPPGPHQLPDSLLLVQASHEMQTEATATVTQRPVGTRAIAYEIKALVVSFTAIVVTHQQPKGRQNARASSLRSAHWHLNIAASDTLAFEQRTAPDSQDACVVVHSNARAVLLNMLGQRLQILRNKFTSSGTMFANRRLEPGVLKDSSTGVGSVHRPRRKQLDMTPREHLRACRRPPLKDRDPHSTLQRTNS